MKTTNSWSELGLITNYSFSGVPKLVISGYKNVIQKGYHNIVGQIIVSHPTVDNYTVSITFWVLSDGSPKPFSAQQTFFGLKDLPSFIVDELYLHNEYQVRMAKEDLECLQQEMKMYDINTSSNSLTSVVRDRAISLGCRTDLSIEIMQDAFYYKVKVLSADGLKPLFEMLTLPVVGLTDEAKKKLDIDHHVTINVKY